MYSLFNHWICEDFSSFLASLFFLIFPIISPLSYGWSFLAERKTGYVKNVLTRTEKWKYYAAKYAAVIISGGAVLLTPIILNILIVSLFIPAVVPDIYYDTAYAVRMPSMFSHLFYTYPGWYMFLRVLLAFLFGGGLAALSFSLAFFTSKHIVAVLLPFLLSLGLHYGESIIPQEMQFGELSPFYIISANGTQLKILWVAIAELFIIYLLSLIPCIVKGKNEDVF